MYRRNKGYALKDFVTVETIQQPEPIESTPTPIQKDDPTRVSVSRKKEKVTKEVIKEIRKNNTINNQIDTYEQLQSKFLLHKNKSNFIRRNKKSIKSLPKVEQAKFINLAKGFF